MYVTKGSFSLRNEDYCNANSKSISGPKRFENIYKKLKPLKSAHLKSPKSELITHRDTERPKRVIYNCLYLFRSGPFNSQNVTSVVH